MEQIKGPQFFLEESKGPQSFDTLVLRQDGSSDLRQLAKFDRGRALPFLRRLANCTDLSDEGRQSSQTGGSLVRVLLRVLSSKDSDPDPLRISLTSSLVFWNWFVKSCCVSGVNIPVFSSLSVTSGPFRSERFGVVFAICTNLFLESCLTAVRLSLSLMVLILFEYLLSA
jgi:hypothetical protein